MNRQLTKNIQMANKQMKNGSTSYVIREMQINIIIRYYYTPLRKAKLKTVKSPNSGEDVEQQELSFISGENEKWYNHFGRQFGSFSQN